MATQFGTCVTVAAPAKLNLFLEILGRRADGFHELDTVLFSVSHCDFVEFRATQSTTINLSFRYRRLGDGKGIGNVDTGFEGTSNLVYRAAELLRAKSGTSHGAVIRLWKRIPLASGLGGGSSDAAATLRAANSAWGLHWPLAKLLPLAQELGSDVPFFLHRGASSWGGRGDVFRQPALTGRCFAVVVIPSVGNSTAQVYRESSLPTSIRSNPWMSGHSRPFGPIRTSKLLFNRLTEPAIRNNPAIDSAIRELRRCGVDWPAVSGSGSSCFGILRNQNQAHCVANRLRARGWNAVAVHSVGGFPPPVLSGFPPPVRANPIPDIGAT
ncbi:MAG TPA: 4-(cytidine 5'-diphospho)-2-C-methyl-D-erythritol kinase [Pirellulaceae bacterium]